MQVNWISYAINLNEKNFDKIVRSAMKNVVKRLQDDEQMEAYSVINGYSVKYNRQDVKSANGNFSRVDVNAQKSNFLGLEVFTNSCQCADCERDRQMAYTRLIQYTESANQRPLEERVSPEALNAYLEQELMDGGIQIDYTFGVFSDKKNSFVIVDDHYVVEDGSPKEFLPDYKNLHTSQYYVNVFPNENPAPGLLMVHFPSKASVVWGNVWRNLLGSILFTSIILFCFVYTIMVIFRQKKLGEMKGDFINNMTHEFKTPIATISLAADSITSPMISGSPDKVKRFADIIKQENKRMNNQVEKVLQMALLDKQDFSLRISEINLHDIIIRAVENIGLQVEKKNGTAIADLKATRPVIEGDVTHISNIINNLLDNANKYSPENPEISVHTRNVRNGVEVIVKDRGMGMSREARKHIFDKFYRVHTGNLHDIKGFGLGLSYVKAMIDAHKGTINVKSDLGKGSSFILTFPHKTENL
jgi:two-component system phosphate regulon sensor histidine kinase PhoR